MKRRTWTRHKRPEANNKCVTYVRVSSKEQQREGYSLQAQAALLDEYAARKDFQIVKRFSEVESAKAAGRSQFRAMLEFFEEEKRQPEPCRVLIVQDTSRLYRNRKDSVTLDELDLEIHLVREGSIISEDSRSNEKLMHEIRIAVAKNEIDVLSERVMIALEQKVKSGGWPHIAPIGYRNALGDDDKNAIAIDPEQARFVRELFQLYSSGQYSITAVRQKLTTDGFRTNKGNKLSKSQIHKMLRNPFYYGEMEWRGELWEGRHESLIERVLFDRVQDRLSGKRTTSTGTRKPRWDFQRLIKCGHCGRSMVAEMQKGHVYYHCTRPKMECPEPKWAKEADIKAAFSDALEQIAFDEIHVDWVLQSLRETHKDRFAFKEQRVAELQREDEKIAGQLKVAYRDRLNEVITPEHYLECQAELNSRRQVIRQRLDELQGAKTIYVAEGARILELAQKAGSLFEKQSRTERRRLVEIVFSNANWKHQQLHYEFRKPFDVLALIANEAKQRKGALPKKSALSAKWLPVHGRTPTRNPENILGCNRDLWMYVVDVPTLSGSAPTRRR